MVPDPIRLSVPLFVKVVDVIVVPVNVVVPPLLRVVIAHVPPKERVPIEALFKVPVPANADPTVNEPLFITAMLAVIFGIDQVP